MKAGTGRMRRKGYERDHLKTVGDDGWFVHFRLYALEQPFFDKTFTLDGFEMVDCQKAGRLGWRGLQRFDPPTEGSTPRETWHSAG